MLHKFMLVFCTLGVVGFFRDFGRFFDGLRGHCGVQKATKMPPNYDHKNE